MGIKILKPQLNKAGNIKIGRKGEWKKSQQGNEFQQPERLDHFLITTTERDDNNNFVEDSILMDLIKESGGRLNTAGNITGIPVTLLYNDNELNFPTRLASYQNGINVCYGDGEESFNRMDDFKKSNSCPCTKFTDPKYPGTDKCKANGTLSCMVEEAGSFGQIYQFRTTSINSVRGIMSGLELITKMTSGKIAGLPLILVVDNKTTVIPATGQSTTIQVVSLCYRGNVEMLRNDCIKLLEADKNFDKGIKLLEYEAKNIGAGVVVPDGEDREFQEEFYPDSAKHLSAKDEIINVEAKEIVEEVVEKVEPEQKTIATLNKDGSIKSIKIKSVQTPETEIIEVKIEKPVDNSKAKTEPEIINTRDILTGEDKKRAKELIEESKKDKEKWLLFIRLQKESDPEKAIALARRNDKKYLIQYFKKYRSNDMPDIKAGKPELIKAFEDFVSTPIWKEKQAEFINNKPIDNTEDSFITELKAIERQPDMVAAIRAKFPEKVINGTMAPSDLMKLAEKLLSEEINKSPSVEKPEMPVEKTKQQNQQITIEDEPGAESTQEQKQEIDLKRYVADPAEPVLDLKEGQMIFQQMVALKKSQKIDDAKWGEIVSKFTNKDGNPLGKAIEMTKSQADFMLELINPIPF